MTSRTRTRALWGLAAACLLGAAASLGQTFEVIHYITPAEGNDPQSGLIQLPDGRFIGTTVGDGDVGTLFQMDANGNLTTLHRFEWSRDGANPHAPLCIGPKGSLYGTVLNGLLGWGGIYEYEPDGTFNVLKAFVKSPNEGATPHAPLIWLKGRSGNTYFGVTTGGGTKDLGTIFAIDAADTIRTLHSFTGPDGAHPFESLHYYNGFLYGTTTSGGSGGITTSSGGGTIFRMSTDGITFQTLYNFSPSSGTNPEAPLICVNGKAYGTTSNGGAYGKGTIFRFDPTTHQVMVLHNFKGADGATPHAGLTLARDGYLYGTTKEGGTCSRPNCFTPGGTIFRIETTLNRFQVIHTLDRDRDGSEPQSRLIVANDGSLYGTTARGGEGRGGVIFRLVFPGVDEKIR